MQVMIPEDVLFKYLDGEAVLIHFGSGSYFGLDPVGTRIWQRLTEHRSTERIIPLLLDEFDTDEIQLRFDLDNLVMQLVEKRLLVPVDSAA